MNDRDSFGDFVEVLLGDFRLGGGRSEWENATLDDFFEALASFAEARVVGESEQEQASWELFAQMLVAATGYE